jgi:DNA-binding NtrC family response regulator
VDAAAVRLALPAAAAGDAAGALPGSGPLAERVEAYEREVILAELRRQQFHMTNTARALGLERSHLYKKCQHLGIDLRAARKAE